MSFDALESSLEEGRPVALYVFTFGSVVWRYTSADKDLVVGGNTYKAAAISDDGVRQSGEAAADMLTMNGPSWIGPAQVFMRGAPSKGIELTILEKHEGNAETKVRYSGEVSQVNFPLPGAARIICETLSATLQREGLRLGWQRSCPYAVYDPLTCKVNKASFDTPLVVLGISGFQITVDGIDALADGYLDGGFIEWTHPVRGVEFIPIESHVDDVLTALTNINELYVGATGVAYPGCDFTPTTCEDVFSNYDNYGGYPGLPGKSPFDGNPVF